MRRPAKGLERLRALANPERLPWHPAIIHLGLGEHDRAIDAHGAGVSDRDWQLRMLPVEPLLDSCGRIPGFVRLPRRFVDVHQPVAGSLLTHD